MRDVLARVRESARRIDAATPVSRDRSVDALRALAILGVVLGHWLVTALVDDGAALHGASPLQHLPQLTPVSWAVQTLAVFFLVGGQVAAQGYAAARARGVAYRGWLRARLARLFRPVAALLGLWAVAALGLLASGTDLDTVRTLLKLVLSPLWFLLVFAGLTALTPLVARLHPLWPLAVVLHVDVLRFGLEVRGLGAVNVLAGWLVPYCLGAALARGAFASRTAGWVLLVGGVGVTAGLVVWGGYPASMVGVPGAAVSNLNPPTLAAVTFGLAQCGGAVLVAGRLRRALGGASGRPSSGGSSPRARFAWAAVAWVNLSALTLFLWHQTALLAVTASGLLAGRGGPLPGLHTVPDEPAWVLARLAWLPVFALALGVCWAAFRRVEQRAGARRGGGTVVVRGHIPEHGLSSDRPTRATGAGEA